jgi:hypothetical protein
VVEKGERSKERKTRKYSRQGQRTRRRLLVPYLHHITDESDIDDVRRNLADYLEDDVRATADALLEGRWEPPLQIYTRGLSLEGNEKERVESEIRRIVVDELVDDVLAQGVRPEPKVLPESQGSAAFEVSLRALSGRSTSSIGSSSRGLDLDLPEADLRRIEARVKERIKPIVESLVRSRPGARAVRLDCVCGHTNLGTPFKVHDPDTGEETTDITVLDRAPGVDPQNDTSWKIAIYPDRWNEIVMDVSRDFYPGLAEGHMQIWLKVETDWPKAIELRNFCHGMAGELRCEKGVSSGKEIADGCQQDNTQTLRFTKPGTWGFWHEVLHPNYEDLWALLNKRYVYFTWRKDR